MGCGPSSRPSAPAASPRPERLGLSPSAVGKAVARLEQRLGARLLQRTTRRLSLTDEGRLYLESCLRALEELEEGRAALSARRDAPSGRLRASLPDLFGRLKLAPTLFALAQEHPALSLELAFDNRRADLVDQGLDLIVRIGALPDRSDLVARRIGEQKLLFCAAPFYLARHPPLEGRADLSIHQRISQAREGHEEPWLFVGETGLTERMAVDAGHRFSALDVVAEAACAGLGVAQLPLWLAQDHLDAGRLRPVLDTLPQPSLPIQAAWPRARGVAPRVRVAVEALASVLKS